MKRLTESLHSFSGRFFGGWNHTFFKNTLLTLLAIRITQQTDDPSNLIAGIFVLPFFLFSARAGQLAKKYNRVHLTDALKLTELCLMLVAAAVFLTKNTYLLILIPLVLGTVSVFFGAMKYAFLPEYLEPDDLITGNTYIEKSTYASIVLAVLVGTLLPVRVAAVCLIVFSVLAYLIVRTDTPKDDEKIEIKPVKNIFKGIYSTVKTVSKYPMIFRSILGATWFWSTGMLLVLLVYPLTQTYFGAPASAVAVFMFIFAAGLWLGAGFCNKLLKGLAHTTFVPITSIAMGVCFLVTFFLLNGYEAPAEPIGLIDFILQVRILAVCFVFFALAFFAGMYVVPLNAFMQSRAPKAYLGTVFAANNLINAAGIAISSVVVTGLRYIGLSMPELFLFAAIVNLFVAFYNCTVLPDALLRSIMQTILEFFYRVTVKGLPNVKTAGKRVLIIANHTSRLDALLVAAFMPEKITFTVSPEIQNTWYIRLFGLMVDIEPLDLNNPLSLRTLVNLIKRNKKVMIFPERRISVTGSLMKIYEGAGIIAAKADANILPIRINGAQYSKLSLLKKTVRTHFFPKITLTVLPPKKFDIDPNLTGRERNHKVSNQLYDMMVEMMYESSKINENIFVSMFNAQKTHGKNHIIAEDINRKPLKYKTLLLKSCVLGQAFKKSFKEEETVGLMMPNVLASIVAFLGLMSVDKVPAMVNFTAGAFQVISSLKTVQIRTVLTSKKFIESAQLEHLRDALLEAGFNIVYLEDVAANLSLGTKLKGIAGYLLARKPKADADQTAAILFTSGSEGTPKAVLLSHKNLQANRYQASIVMGITSSDIYFNALPMFHSFGLGVGLTMMMTGAKVFFYPSPLHYRIISELVYDTNATILCATDTFLAGYGNAAHPYDFFSLRFAVVGAEKLKESTANLWMNKFGIRLFEGYGATEAAPIVSVNSPMATRKGSVGRLLPKMEYRLEEVPGITEGKRLFVRGDNIMQGYMKADNPGVLQPPEGGWHDTGDIVDIDEDGFIFIKGRAKRFAKVGGEMVSLTAVEQILNKLYPDIVQGVVTIPDEKKGEQLVLITTKEDASVSEMKAFFKKEGYVELWVPSRIMYIKEPPLMGTGKFNYVKATEMAVAEFVTKA